MRRKGQQIGRKRSFIKLRLQPIVWEQKERDSSRLLRELLGLREEYCAVYSVQCRLYSVDCTVYIVHCTQLSLYTIHFTVYVV